MDTRFPIRPACVGCLAAALIAGCATSPPDPTRTVSMGRQDSAPTAEFPPPGTIWRLDADELKALGPILPTPDPPPAPPRASRSDRDDRVLLVPSIVYYGSRFGIGWGDGPYWPHYRFPPYPRYYHPWYHRRR